MKKQVKKLNHSDSTKIKKFIKTEIKPYIQMDGGDIKFIDFNIKSGEVRVKLMGACVGCVLSSITLKFGVEQQLKDKFKSVTKVIMID